MKISKPTIEDAIFSLNCLTVICKIKTCVQQNSKTTMMMKMSNNDKI